MITFYIYFVLAQSLANVDNTNVTDKAGGLLLKTYYLQISFSSSLGQQIIQIKTKSVGPKEEKDSEELPNQNL